MFANHQSLMVHPLLVKYQFKILEDKNQWALPLFGVAVPKRQFRRAHDRNLIKRRIREVYRLNWQKEFQACQGIQLNVMYIMIGKTIPKFETLEYSMVKVLKQLNDLQKGQDLAPAKI